MSTHVQDNIRLITHRKLVPDRLSTPAAAPWDAHIKSLVKAQTGMANLDPPLPIRRLQRIRSSSVSRVGRGRDVATRLRGGTRSVSPANGSDDDGSSCGRGDEPSRQFVPPSRLPDATSGAPVYSQIDLMDDGDDGGGGGGDGRAARAEDAPRPPLHPNAATVQVQRGDRLSGLVHVRRSWV